MLPKLGQSVILYANGGVMFVISLGFKSLGMLKEVGNKMHGNASSHPQDSSVFVLAKTWGETGLPDMESSEFSQWRLRVLKARISTHVLVYCLLVIYGIQWEYNVDITGIYVYIYIHNGVKIL